MNVLAQNFFVLALFWLVLKSMSCPPRVGIFSIEERCLLFIVSPPSNYNELPVLSTSGHRILLSIYSQPIAWTFGWVLGKPEKKPCPSAPEKPRRADNCNWIPILDRNNCIVDYECEPSKQLHGNLFSVLFSDNIGCK